MLSFFFISGAHWEGPLNAVWIDAQCENMCKHEHIKKKCSPKKLDDCKNSCDSTEGCTAINYRNETESCGLRKCSLPVEFPKDKKTAEDWGYDGYRIVQGKIEDFILSSL